MADLDPETRELLAAQKGVVALWQLDAVNRRRVQRGIGGRWRWLTSRTAFHGPQQPDDLALLWAALLHCGPDARIAGRNAMMLNGWKTSLQKPVHVAVPVGCTVPKSDLVIAHRLKGITGPNAAPARVDVHQAAIQAAAWASSDRSAMVILISALQQRLISAERIGQVLAGMPRVHRRQMILHTVAEFVDGAQSLNEVDLGDLCRRNDLPPPVRQVMRLDANGRPRSIDAEFTTISGRRLHVEVEGAHHLDPDQWLRDTRRHNSLVLAGEGVYLKVLAWELKHDPEAFLADLRQGINDQPQELPEAW